jgi:hypothetical protein
MYFQELDETNPPKIEFLIFLPDTLAMGFIMPFVKASIFIVVPRMIVSAESATRKWILIIFYIVRIEKYLEPV